MRTRFTLCILLVLLSQLVMNVSPVQAANVSVTDAALSTVLIFAFDRKEDVIGSGSGALITTDGLVLTNHHVIADNRRRDGRVAIFVPRSPNANQEEDFTGYLGTILDEASDPDADLALIQIDRTLEGKKLPSRTKFPALALGDSDELLIGDKLYILGYPDISYNSLTLTDGLVSGFQEADGLPWILTAAVISHGNSGGVVINERGDLVAVPTRVETGTFSDATMGYLRPINVAKAMIASVTLAEEIAHTDEEATLLFSDSFDNNDNSWGLDSISDQYANCDFELADGVLRHDCRFKQEAIEMMAIPNLAVKNFTLSFEFTLLERGGNENFTHLGVRIRQNKQREYYDIAFSQEGSITILAIIGGEAQEIQAWQPTDAFELQPGETNQFTIQMIEQQLVIFVNEQAVAVFEDVLGDETLSRAGTIGLGLWAAKGQSVSVEFDNVQVTEATPEMSNHEPVSFEESFQSNQNGWDLGKFSTDYNSGEDRINQGKLRTKVNCQQDGPHFIIVPEAQAQDFILTVDTKIVQSEGDTAWINIGFSVNDETIYVVMINNQGDYAMSRYDFATEEWTTIEELTETDLIETRTGKRNLLELRAEASQITLVINGEEVATVETEEELANGAFLLAAGCSADGSVTVEFDNLSITELASNN